MKSGTTAKKAKNQVIPSKAEVAAQSLHANGPGILELLQFGSQAILKPVGYFKI